MIKLVITLEDESTFYMEIDQEWLEYILDYPNSPILSDMLDIEEAIEKENSETLADVCKALNIDVLQVKNKLITKFKRQYGKEAAKTYMNHIL